MTTYQNQQVSGPRKRRKPKPTGQELVRRRLQNKAAFWQQRYEACGEDHGELARVSFDRARSAASSRLATNPMAMYELAQMLSEWSERLEKAEAERHAS